MADGMKVLFTGGVRPLYGCAWQGGSTQTDPTYSKINRFLSCPTSGGGVGRDWLDGISVHHYTYEGDGREMLQEGIDFKARFAQFGVSGLPWMWSEVGHEIVLANTLSDIQHTTNVIRWCYIAAAQGASNLHMYQLDTDDLARNLKFYATENTSSKIASNDALQGAIETAYAICGKTIGQAARLTDGSIWMEFTDGTQVRR
jgi:hypothetical protein